MTQIDAAAPRGLATLLTPVRAALLVALAALATILGALFIEHVLGVKPCELCLKQRIPYYSGIPLAAVAAFAAARAPRSGATVALLALVGLVFAAGAALGAYHAGVEWGLWAGPSDCTGAIAKPAAMGDFLRQLETVKVVRCDEVAMRIFGLSLAAWNAVIATGLAAVAFMGAARAARAA
ncbi:disulfide bond formation protein B [Alsobacter sp. SYSU M60028]|uniref:Disulfide bond formation protein B n=1 Tax=Alsobacter ponti TaxID=2962936 RepID=A0ABT1LGU6_9HYPH|nr:disulfide bond formation protein B [Alsobacter ponti]MCP8940669.1 disulfide bond formation protein B [Alsobacter ponti]